MTLHRFFGITLLGSVVFTLLCASCVAEAEGLAFTSFFYQGSTQTYALGINNNSQIVGNATPHGFIYSGGNFTTIDYPNARQTNPTGINNTGQIVGWYLANDASMSCHAFLYVDGNFTSIDYPNGTCTNAYGINDAGQIVGTYYDGVTQHGFLDSGGNFTSIDDPNADPLGIGTVTQGVNNAGQIVGFYYDALKQPHGFLYSSGNFTTIDVPNATGAIYALGINNDGQIVGYYQDASGHYRGFLDSGGSFTTVDYPNADLTYAYGINDSGQISGTSATNNVGVYGFLATPNTLDTLPPTTSAVPSPVPNANGWNNTNVTVNLNATDNSGGSGVKQIQFSLRGAQSMPLQTVAGSAASVMISAEGIIILSYFATDNAGNQEATKTLTIRIDKMPPVISGMPAPGCTIWPPNHKLVQVGTVTATDALSGLAPGSFNVTGTGTNPNSCQIVITGGPSQFNVQLGADKDTVYTLTARASDVAGNIATAQSTCTVPHDEGK